MEEVLEILNSYGDKWESFFADGDFVCFEAKTNFVGLTKLRTNDVVRLFRLMKDKGYKLVTSSPESFIFEKDGDGNNG